MKARPRILVTQKVPPQIYSLLAEVGEVEGNMDEETNWNGEELEQHTRGYDYLLCMVTNTIDAHLLETCA